VDEARRVRFTKRGAGVSSVDYRFVRFPRTLRSAPRKRRGALLIRGPSFSRGLIVFA
jgi:hypothetical protein